MVIVILNRVWERFVYLWLPWKEQRGDLLMPKPTFCVMFVCLVVEDEHSWSCALTYTGNKVKETSSNF